MRFPLNLNVLDATPHAGRDEPQAGADRLARRSRSRCCSHRARTRIGKIDDRLELLDGFLIAFLNLDRVIEIIRTEDEPKPVMIAEFALTDRQAEAILNMRLRRLRRLEEMEIAKERDGAGQGARGAGQAGREPGAAAHPAEARPRSGARTSSATRGGRGSRKAGGDARHRLVGDDREGADHRHPVAARLDPGDEGPCRAGRDRRRSSGARATGRSSHFHAQTTDRLALFARERAGLHAGRRTNCPAGAASASRCGCSIDLDGRGRDRRSCWWSGRR